MRRKLTAILFVLTASFAQAKSWTDDFSPSLFATSSVQVVEALSNAIPSVSPCVPQTKADLSGAYIYSQGIDASGRLYLFSDDTYMRVYNYSFMPMSIEDMGTWDLKAGLVRLIQTEKHLTNFWTTADVVFVPIRNGNDMFMVGGHWGYSLLTASVEHDRAGDYSLLMWGHRRVERLASDSSAREKSRILKRWEEETSWRRKAGIEKLKDGIQPGAPPNTLSPSAQGVGGR